MIAGMTGSRHFVSSRSTVVLRMRETGSSIFVTDRSTRRGLPVESVAWSSVIGCSVCSLPLSRDYEEPDERQEKSVDDA